MSVLDIDERIEQADKQADLYLRWKAEDDEFQKKHPDSFIYSWFAEHSKTWKPEPAQDVYVDPYNIPPSSELEKAYGKPHIKFGPGNPIFIIYYICPAQYSLDIAHPELPPDKSKAPSLGGPTAFSKMVQLNQVEITVSSPDGMKLDFNLRFPPVICLKDVTEWPDWLIDSRNCKCRQPWDNVTFWVDDSCNTTPINKLIYQPGTSHRDPVGYNFFRPSDYFLGF